VSSRSAAKSTGRSRDLAFRELPVELRIGRLEIGYTMSLFIGGLAWEHADFENPVRLGVLTGSLLAGIGGYLVLWWTSPAGSAPSPRSPHV
jgi:Na+/H+ antiporter NhaA